MGLSLRRACRKFPSLLEPATTQEMRRIEFEVRIQSMYGVVSLGLIPMGPGPL